MTIEEKFEKLKKFFRDAGSVATAFSGGTDSTFLLKIAKEVLGEKAIAITAVSEFFPARETEEAKDFCRREKIRQIVFEEKILDVENIADNPANRCYLCKKNLFSKILSIAEENKISCVAEGSNTDDDKDYRPGMKAIEELKIKSPLKYAGLSKAEIRELSKKF